MVTNPGPSPDPTQIGSWLTALSSELESIEEQIEPLIDRREEIKRQIDLLEELQRSVQPDGATEGAPTARSQAAPERWSLGSVGERVRAQVRQILDDNGAAMHINEIHAEFKRRGYGVPGAGRPNNITAHLSRGDEEFVSAKRGVYDLRDRS